MQPAAGCRAAGGAHQIVHLADGALEVQGMEVGGRLQVCDVGSNLRLHLQHSQHLGRCIWWLGRTG